MCTIPSLPSQNQRAGLHLLSHNKPCNIQVEILEEHEEEHKTGLSMHQKDANPSDIGAT